MKNNSSSDKTSRILTVLFLLAAAFAGGPLLEKILKIPLPFCFAISGLFFAFIISAADK